jgi:hypothetical protein
LPQRSAEGERSCCASEAQQAPEDQPSDAPCRCHEVGNDRLRFDTSTKVLLPSLALDFLTFPLPASAAPVLACDDFVMLVSSRLDRPPPASLLAQHCLLII